MKKIVMLTAFLLTLSTILFAQDTVQEAQALAIKQHPDLAVAGSPFHERFINAYNAKKASSPEFFDSVDWPVKLADEVTPKTDDTTLKIVKGYFGGNKVFTEYKGTEMLAGQPFPYTKQVSIEMTLSPNKKTDFFYVAQDSKKNTFQLTLSEDDVTTFTAMLEKAVEFHAIAEKSNVTSFSKPLGTIAKDSYSFSRSATGVSFISIISPQEPGKPWSFDLGHYIEMAGVTTSLELLKTRASLQSKTLENAKEVEERKRKNDELFK